LVKKNSAQARTAVRGVRDSLAACVKAPLERTARSNSIRRHGAAGILARRKSRAPTDVEKGVARILDLQRQLVLMPAKSRQHRDVMKQIRLEAALYRKSLDVEQMVAWHDPRPKF
jgi:hypothetical protein